MNQLTARPVVMFAASGLMLGAIATPAQAADLELDDAEVAAGLCPAGATPHDSDWTDDDSGVEGSIYTYESDGAGGVTNLCTFAIISTDDESTLDGTYALSIGGQQRTGPVTRSATITSPIMSTTADSASALLAAGGRQTTVEVTKVSTSAKKAAKKALAASKKKAKRAYLKAGRTSSANKAMKRAVATATKKYARAIAPRSIVTKLPYRLDLTLDLALEESIEDDLP